MQTTEQLGVAMEPSSKQLMEEIVGSARPAEQLTRFSAFLLPTRITEPRLATMGQFSEQPMAEPIGLVRRAGPVQQVSGTLYDLLRVSFTDANNGTTVDQFGTILRTTDGGEHWVPQENGTTELLAGVSFTDTNHGMACGAFGIILRTTDGGETWVRETSGTDYDLSRISCTGARAGTAVRYGGSIFRRETVR